MHISIAGNIGSGKTTLAHLLSKHFGWSVHLEDVVNNPYLDDFYNNMARWSFKLQIFFLSERFKSVINIQKNKKNVIQDRTIYEDVHIFAPNLLDMGLMTQRDFSTYKNLFGLIQSLVSPPDMLIYLRSSTENLIKQIQKRGRVYEDSISKEYLSRLNERYEAWIYNYENKYIIVDVDELDFVNNSEQFNEVINKIKPSIKEFLGWI